MNLIQRFSLLEMMLLHNGFSHITFFAFTSTKQITLPWVRVDYQIDTKSSKGYVQMLFWWLVAYYVLIDGQTSPPISPYLLTIYHICKMFNGMFVVVHHPFHMDLLIFLVIFMKRLELILAKRTDLCHNTNYIIDLHHNYEVVDENISLLRKFIKGLHGL